MKKYLQIKIKLTHASHSDILIAQLSESGFDGFEEGQGYLNAFIREERFDQESLQKIILHNGVAYKKKIIDERNWNEKWEKSFKPVIVNDFCAIRASFHEAVKTTRHEIIITPKMSFGTGHHPSTYLMIEAISKIDCSDKSVMDFGTGTGVLSILAEKCGAKNIVAIDNDDWSIENARENISKNNCSKISIQQADSMQETNIFDIILANINRSVILQHFSSFREHLNQSGILILSGIISSDYPDVEFAANQNQFQIVSKSEQHEWICIILSSFIYF